MIAMATLFIAWLAAAPALPTPPKTVLHLPIVLIAAQAPDQPAPAAEPTATPTDTPVLPDRPPPPGPPRASQAPPGAPRAWRPPGRPARPPGGARPRGMGKKKAPAVAGAPIIKKTGSDLLRAAFLFLSTAFGSGRPAVDRLRRIALLVGHHGDAQTLGQAKSLQSTYLPQIEQKARTLDVGQVVQMARSLAVLHNRTVRVGFRSDSSGSCYVVHSGGPGACTCDASGAATVINAMGAGRRAAASIHAYLCRPDGWTNQELK